MTAADKPEFAATLAVLARTLGVELDPLLLDGYWLALSAWPLHEFKQAAAHLLGTAKFMPRPADFTALRRKAGEQAAADAWTAVLRSLRAGDYRLGHTVGGKADRVVRAMGGYQSLAMRESQALHTFGAKRFAELWDELGELAEARAVLPHLAPPAGLLRVDGPRAVSAFLPGLVQRAEGAP